MLVQWNLSAHRFSWIWFGWAVLYKYRWYTVYPVSQIDAAPTLIVLACSAPCKSYDLVSLASQTLSVPPSAFSILKGIGTAGWKGSESDRHCGMERVWLVRLALSRGVFVTLYCPGGDHDKLHHCSSVLIICRDGGLWTGRVGSAECQRPPITMATSVLSHQEMLRQLHLRRHIDDLKMSVEEREQAVRENR